MTLGLVGGREIGRSGRVRKGGATPCHLFYADDGLVVSTDPDWLQEEFDTLTGLFDRVVMRKNVGNTVGMVFCPLRE